MASEPGVRLTEKEYLEIERSAEIRHEFLDGEMFATSGGSISHSFLQGNIYFELRNRLQGTACVPIGPDLRLRVSRDVSTYPDLSVVCCELEAADDDKDSYVNPAVIFEVLSTRTEKYDRGRKLHFYRSLKSLRDYVLVDQQAIAVEQYTRSTDGTWVFRDYRNLDDELRIDSIQIAIPLQAIYHRVSLAAE